MIWVGVLLASVVATPEGVQGVGYGLGQVGQGVNRAGVGMSDVGRSVTYASQTVRETRSSVGRWFATGAAVVGGVTVAMVVAAFVAPSRKNNGARRARARRSR